jgi:hypothetical protein
MYPFVSPPTTMVPGGHNPGSHEKDKAKTIVHYLKQFKRSDFSSPHTIEENHTEALETFKTEFHVLMALRQIHNFNDHDIGLTEGDIDTFEYIAML